MEILFLQVHARLWRAIQDGAVIDLIHKHPQQELYRLQSEIDLRGLKECGIWSVPASGALSAAQTKILNAHTSAGS